MRVLFTFFAFVSVVGFANFAFAQDEAEPEKPMTIYEEIQMFSENFDDVQERHFYTLYGSYNLISVVREVQGQVANAIDKCSDANPDMKDALRTRHNDWKDALKPILEEADAHVDNMIMAQDYADSKEIKRILKLNDELRASKNLEVEKYPVTTPEACEYLRVKMDETESNLTQLLRSTLVTMPQELTDDGDSHSDEDTDSESE